MPTDLQAHIDATPIVNTHEHQHKENAWIENGPDILQSLFANYVPADLHTAGASPESVRRLLDGSDPDIEGRFEGIREAWEAVKFTGYGEAVRIVAREFYGIEELTAKSIAAAQPRHAELLKPGERYRILHDLANMDHIQVDDFSWPCLPDASGPDFFLYDISWANFCDGRLDVKAIAEETGIDVVDLPSLRRAMETIFEKYAPCAIAVKAQHAYGRTLEWHPRSDAEAETALQAILTKPAEEIDVATRLCLGDWAWARGVELATEHRLPFKLHTGYYAGNDRMPVQRIRAGNLCELLSTYLDAKFVLMHIAYPYNDELVGLAKHYRNIWIDFCWGWSIDPYSAQDCLRRCIHAVPANKVLAFGGDTGWPTASYAYAVQARNGIRRALEAEIADGAMTESEAMRFATRIMRENQYACFDVEGTRAAIAAAMA